LPVEIVPGLTAAQAVASQAGAPLGHDYVVLSLSDRLKPWRSSRRLEARHADFAIAIYNPASNSRRQQLVDARELLLKHRAPATPVVIVERRIGGSAHHRDDVGELNPDEVDMRCLLIVGSSQSRVVAVARSHAGDHARRYPS